MSRYRGPGFGRKPNLVGSVFLILAGIVLFLANLNLLPISVHEVWQLWPLIFVAMGVGKISGMRQPGALIVGGMLVVLGVVYTLVNIGAFRIHVHDDSWPLSILFLALGLGGLAKFLNGGSPRWRRPDFPDTHGTNSPPPSPSSWPNHENWAGWSQSADADNAPTLDNYTVMGSINRKIESQNFQGGKLTSILGSIEIDLRRAKMPEGKKTAYLNANAVMGAIKLRVPESWRVLWNGDNVMGAFEDKTIPPNTGTDAPQLVVTGSSVMGTIEIES
jgi:Domain of unknown function (DUF5668)/Cell wall-active antibiotics response 4TMS YvqF